MIGALTIALVSYLYLTNQFGPRELLSASATPTATNEPNNNTSQFNLSPAQKFFLEKAGIDTSKLPQTISPALEACLTKAVGVERAVQIKTGAVPTTTDLLKAQSCF